MKKSKSFQLLSGVTGDDLFSVAPAVVEKPIYSGKMALDEMPMLGTDEPTLHEVLALLEAEAPLQGEEAHALLSPTPASEVGSAMSPNGLEGDGGSHFLEGFTNLDEFLFTENIYSNLNSMVADTPMEIETTITELAVPVVTSTIGKRRKRTALEAFAEIEAATAAINPDHNDYVSKKCKSATVSTSTPEKAVSKELKYRERRNKNNIASKRSRETRKQKFSTMELKAVELEAANQVLERKVVELEELTKKMKDILVKRLSQTS